jgi:hypothetical protein
MSTLGWKVIDHRAGGVVVLRCGLFEGQVTMNVLLLLDTDTHEPTARAEAQSPQSQAPLNISHPQHPPWVSMNNRTVDRVNTRDDTSDMEREEGAEDTRTAGGGTTALEEEEEEEEEGEGRDEDEMDEEEEERVGAELTEDKASGAEDEDKEGDSGDD